MLHPLQVGEALGIANAEAPCVDELIEGGASKRERVMWTLGGKPGSSVVESLLPAALIWPVEKQLSNYLFLKASKKKPGGPRHLYSILHSKRLGKEASHDLQRRYAVLQKNGTRRLKDDAPTRTLKELSFA